jgi:hypothetical protein
MAIRISSFQRKLILSRATNAKAFDSILTTLNPGNTVTFTYKKKGGGTDTLKAKVETGSVTIAKGGKLVTQKKTYLADVDNPASKMDLDDVFAYAGLNMKVDVDGIPRIDAASAERAAEQIEAVGMEDGLGVQQSKAMREAFLEYFNNNPFKQFIDRFRRSRQVADNARPQAQKAKVDEMEAKAESEVELSVSRRALDEPSVRDIQEVAADAADAGKVEQKLDEVKSEPAAKPPIDENPVLEIVDEPLQRITVQSTLEPPGPSVRDRMRTTWQEWRSRPPTQRKAAEAVVTPAPVEEQAIVKTVEKDIPERANRARTENKISAQVHKELTDGPKSSSWTRREKIAAGAVAGTLLAGAGITAGLAWYRARASMAAAASQHQQDLNGCWMYNKLDGTKVKVKLLSCGDLDLASAMETCSTQSFSAAESATITDCAKTTFNPCIQSSKSRSSDPLTPLVPNVCDRYVYNTPSAPTAIEGVTTVPACRKLDGTSLPAKQSCSPYCQSENFNLPPHLALMCVDVDFSTAFVDLVSALGYNPDTIFPPANAPSPPASPGLSKPVFIALTVIGVVLLIALGVFWFKN